MFGINNYQFPFDLSNGSYKYIYNKKGFGPIKHRNVAEAV